MRFTGKKSFFDRLLIYKDEKICRLIIYKVSRSSITGIQKLLVGIVQSDLVLKIRRVVKGSSQRCARNRLGKDPFHGWRRLLNSSSRFIRIGILAVFAVVSHSSDFSILELSPLDTVESVGVLMRQHSSSAAVLLQSPLEQWIRHVLDVLQWHCSVVVHSHLFQCSAHVFNVLLPVVLFFLQDFYRVQSCLGRIRVVLKIRQYIQLLTLK